MFRTALSGQERYITCSGSPEKILYEGKFLKNGTFDLVKKGVDSLYDYIQSFKDSVDIHVIIKKYMNGDLSALNKVEGQYADISDIPDNFIDIYNSILHAEATFNNLPVEIREKFGNSFTQFGSSIDSPDFADKLGIIKEVQQPVEQPKVDEVGKEEIA